MHFIPFFLTILYVIYMWQTQLCHFPVFYHAPNNFYLTNINLQMQNIATNDPAWLVKLILFCSIILISIIYFRVFAVNVELKKSFHAVENSLQKDIYYMPPEQAISWAYKLKNDLMELKSFDYMLQREQAILQFDAILSEYLSKRWELNSEKLTSPEIINIVKGRSIPSNEVEHLNILLTQADIIKFSQMLPREFDWQYLFTLMENALENV